jgi:hypothetical protein
MTNDKIRELAQEAGFRWGFIKAEGLMDGMIDFANLVAEHEREACALRAEEFLAEPEQEWGGDFWNQAIERVALAIRARGQA